MPAAAAPGVNWLQKVTDQVTALTTAYSGQLVDLASRELAFIALIALVTMVCRWQLMHMVIGFHPVNFTMGHFFEFLIKLLFCAAMLHYYNSPLPGGLNLHQIPQAVGSAISNNLDAAVYDDLSNRISSAIDGTTQPSGLDLNGILIYFSVLLLMSLLDLAMFAINAFGFVGYAMFALFGPLFVPLLLTRNFAGKFWMWLDGLIMFGMYQAVAQGITFIWLHVLIGFFDNSIAGDYSIGNWLAVFTALLMLSIAFFWSMFKVPMLTNMLFGGSVYGAQAATDSFVAGAARAVVKVAAL